MYVKKNKGNKQLTDVSVTDFNLTKWIDTPFSFTHAFVGRSVDRKEGSKISSGLTLVQQQVMLIVSSKFKRNLEEFYKRGGKDGNKELYLPLFSEDSVRDHLNGFYDIPLNEIETSFKGFDIQRDVVEQLKRISLYVPSPDMTYYYDMVIFSTFRVSPTKRTLEVKLNPDIVKYLLNMKDGYVHHVKAIAEISARKYTPMFYFYMLHLLRDRDRCTVVRPLDELREYLGLVKYANGTVDIECRKYPSFSDFRLKIIEPCKNDLESLAHQLRVDIVFSYEAVYDDPKKKRGNPENLKYTIERNLYGKLAKDVRTGRKDVMKAVQILQGSIFEPVENENKKSDKIPVQQGEGLEQWNAFLSLVIEPSEKSLISAVRFLGMKNARFCIACSDEQMEQINRSGLVKLAKQFFRCDGSLAPVFYRG